MVGFEFPEASLGVSGNVVKISKEWAVGLDSAALESVLALGGYNRQATLLCVHVEDWAARIDNEITQAGQEKAFLGFFVPYYKCLSEIKPSHLNRLPATGACVG